MSLTHPNRFRHVSTPGDRPVEWRKPRLPDDAPPTDLHQSADALGFTAWECYGHVKGAMAKVNRLGYLESTRVDTIKDFRGLFKESCYKYATYCLEYSLAIAAWQAALESYRISCSTYRAPPMEAVVLDVLPTLHDLDGLFAFVKASPNWSLLQLAHDAEVAEGKHYGLDMLTVLGKPLLMAELAKEALEKASPNPVTLSTCAFVIAVLCYEPRDTLMIAPISRLRTSSANASATLTTAPRTQTQARRPQRSPRLVACAANAFPLTSLGLCRGRLL